MIVSHHENAPMDILYSTLSFYFNSPFSPLESITIVMVDAYLQKQNDQTPILQKYIKETKAEGSLRPIVEQARAIMMNIKYDIDKYI